MKTLSLKLDDHIFDETETITAQLHLAQKRRMLKKALAKESVLSSADSMDILREFDMWIDGD